MALLDILDDDRKADAEPHPLPRSCFRCKHLARDTEGWEMPHIWWYECNQMPVVENLWSWPWNRTKCSKFEPRGGR